MGDEHGWQGINGPILIGSEGYWHRVPDEVTAQGTVILTGVMHEYSSDVWCLRGDMVYRLKRCSLYWPDRSGGSKALEHVKELWKEYLKLSQKHSQLIPNLTDPDGIRASKENEELKLALTQGVGEKEHLNSALDEIFAPERKRLRSDIHSAIQNMISLVYSKP